METVLSLDLPFLPKIASGKVREVYAVADDRILLVASDRISAFDVVLNQGIPDKGRVLTQMSAWWFTQTKSLLPNHCLSADDDAVAETLAAEGAVLMPKMRQTLAGRTMLCQRTEPLPIEAVVRGYLSGSAWADYRNAPVNAGMVNLWGIEMPAGLRESDKLPQPIFTPSTKAAEGHDMPLTGNQTADLLGLDRASRVREAALSLYVFAADYALARGIILADTKFEFGMLPSGEMRLIDEALTPDSSRFWDASVYEPGKAQPSFDKQFVRDYLISVPGWDRTPPAPDLPDTVVQGTTARYREAFEHITGEPLS